MPMLYKCSARGCSKILEVQGLCEMHQAKADISNKIRYKVYATNRLMDKEQKKYQQFYSSGAWLRIRDSVISNCYAIDIVEFYRTGRIIQGYTVHHVETLGSSWERRLDSTNLMYLTESNHQFIHKEMNKGKREEKAIQKLLIELKNKFNEEYNL